MQWHSGQLGFGFLQPCKQYRGSGQYWNNGEVRGRRGTADADTGGGFWGRRRDPLWHADNLEFEAIRWRSLVQNSSCSAQTQAGQAVAAVHTRASTSFWKRASGFDHLRKVCESTAGSYTSHAQRDSGRYQLVLLYRVLSPRGAMAQCWHCFTCVISLGCSFKAA